MVFLAAGLLCFAGCGRLPQGAQTLPEAAGLRVAVMPVNNLSGTITPLGDVRQALIRGLRRQGVAVLDDEMLDQFMERHRVRYSAGIDRRTGLALKKETGVDAVLVSSVELYSAADPPKFAMTSRLVSTGINTNILWMDGKGMAGDDSPGILGLGIIEDPHRLIEKTVGSLISSLVDYLSGRNGGNAAGGIRFRPRTAYRSPILDPDAHYRVAVVQFNNPGDRKNAGEIMSLQFLSALAKRKNFEVLDPGVVREKLLRFRVIMDRGLSVSDADLLFQSADVDLIIGGTVYAYEDNRGSYGAPKVEFFVQVFEKKSREVVWSSDSYNKGDDGVFFFDVGRITTAESMAAQMVRNVVAMMVEK